MLFIQVGRCTVVVCLGGHKPTIGKIDFSQGQVAHSLLLFVDGTCAYRAFIIRNGLFLIFFLLIQNSKRVINLVLEVNILIVAQQFAQSLSQFLIVGLSFGGQGQGNRRLKLEFKFGLQLYRLGEHLPRTARFSHLPVNLAKNEGVSGKQRLLLRYFNKFLQRDDGRRIIF